MTTVCASDRPRVAPRQPTGAIALVVAALLSLACDEVGVPLQEAMPPTGPWEVRIELDGGPTVARINVVDIEGHDFWPPGVPQNFDSLGRSFFYASGFELPAEMQGAWITAYKGLEVEGHSGLHHRSGAPTVIRLVRRIDMVARGYRSGDGHVHPEFGPFWPGLPTSLGVDFPVDDATVVEQMQGEDLGLVNALAANGLGDHVWLRDRVTGLDSPASLPDHILRYSEEYRAHAFGHIVAFGVSELSDPLYTGWPFTLHPFDYPPNHDVALAYLQHEQLAACAHLYAPPHECPVDVILGSLSAIEGIGFTVLSDFALDVWERLLSVGYDVALTAGSDAVLSALGNTHAGGTRSYVDMQGLPFSYESWTRQLARGRGFGTNGAMLLLSVDGHQPGDRIALAPGETRSMTVSVEVLSLFPFDTVTIRSNRSTLAEFESDPVHRLRQVFTVDLELSGPGWIYARLQGPFAEGMAPGLLSGVPPHEAATNVVYLDTGEPRFDAESADFLAAWIRESLDELDALDNYGETHQRSYVRSIYAEALDLLEGP